MYPFRCLGVVSGLCDKYNVPATRDPFDRLNSALRQNSGLCCRVLAEPFVSIPRGKLAHPSIGKHWLALTSDDSRE